MGRYVAEIRPAGVVARLAFAIVADREKMAVCAEKSDSNVLVMQSTDHGMRHDASDPLNRAGDWRIFVQ